VGHPGTRPTGFQQAEVIGQEGVRPEAEAVETGVHVENAARGLPPGKLPPFPRLRLISDCGLEVVFEEERGLARRRTIEDSDRDVGTHRSGLPESGGQTFFDRPAEGQTFLERFNPETAYADRGQSPSDFS